MFYNWCHISILQLFVFSLLPWDVLSWRTCVSVSRCGQIECQANSLSRYRCWLLPRVTLSLWWSPKWNVATLYTPSRACDAQLPVWRVCVRRHIVNSHRFLHIENRSCTCFRPLWNPLGIRSEHWCLCLFLHQGSGLLLTSVSAY